MEDGIVMEMNKEIILQHTSSNRKIPSHSSSPAILHPPSSSAVPQAGTLNLPSRRTTPA